MTSASSAPRSHAEVAAQILENAEKDPLSELNRWQMQRAQAHALVALALSATERERS